MDFTYGMPLGGPVGPQIGFKERRKMRLMGNDPYRLPAVEKEKCQAMTLKPSASILTANKGEAPVQCTAPAIKDDVLCVTHRRMTNEAARTEGIRTRGTAIVTVPLKAFEKAKFPLKFMKENESADLTGIPEYIDIYNGAHLKQVVGKLMQS